MESDKPGIDCEFYESVSVRNYLMEVFDKDTYCVETARWEMVFLWALQPIPGMTNFVGNRVDDEIHLSGQQQRPDGQVVLSRIRFFEITSDSFSWEHIDSFDDGDTWHAHTAMTLQRRSAA
jgi:hypothetical protein